MLGQPIEPSLIQHASFRKTCNMKLLASSAAPFISHFKPRSFLLKVIEEAFLAVMAKEPARQEALKVQREAERVKQQAAARALAEEEKRREEKWYGRSHCCCKLTLSTHNKLSKL